MKTFLRHFFLAHGDGFEYWELLLSNDEQDTTYNTGKVHKTHWLEARATKEDDELGHCMCIIYSYCNCYATTIDIIYFHTWDCAPAVFKVTLRIEFINTFPLVDFGVLHRGMFSCMHAARFYKL